MMARLALLTCILTLPTTVSVCLAGEEPGRYTITPAGDGFLRLDSATGAVSICDQKSGGWTCASVADDVSALKQEIDRLARETEELRDRLVKAEASLKATGRGKEPSPAGPSFYIPGLEVDQITDFVTKLIRHLQDMVRDFKQEEAERAL